MTRAVPLIALTAAMALAACSKAPTATEPTDSGSGAAEPGPVVATPLPQASESTPAPMPTPAPTPSPEPRATPEQPTAKEIQASIRGRWGLVPADCTSKLGDAKGLLTVSATQLKFYESVAKLGRVKEVEDDSIRATFNYSGEGQAWTQDVVLDVQNGGKTLIRRDYGPDAMPGALKYTRCS